MVKKLESFKDRYVKVFNTIKSDTFKRGFTHVDIWADTGNFALNRLLSNRYDRSFLYGRSVNIYGESQSGKSLLLAQTAGIEQKKRKAMVIWVDVENSTDDHAGEDWLRRAGVDLDNQFEFIGLVRIEEAQALVSNFVSLYRQDIAQFEEGKIKELPPPVFFIFDSYSALQTDSQWENALKGTTKGDQGQKAKQLGDFILKAGHLVRGLPILITGVHHVYDNQTMINGKPVGGRHKLTGGNKPVYMASQSLLLSKYTLKAKERKQDGTTSDEEDEKIIGIISSAKVLKCRFSKPFEEVDIQIPWNGGIDPYSGLFNLLVQDEIITSPSNSWYEFTRQDKSVQKFRRTEFREYADEMMALPIRANAPVGVDTTPKELQEELEEEAA